MKKEVLVLLPLILLLSNCPKQNKTENELLLEAYTNGDYVKCLEILKDGADGRINIKPPLFPDYPILFDICRKYLDNESGMPEIEELFNFYLKNRKEAFEDSITKTIPTTQTVGSYLARFADVELLRQIAQEKININSPYEWELDEYSLVSTAIYELALENRGSNIHSRYFNDLLINADEKKIRMELLLDAGADVSRTDGRNATIFSYFCWYPMEEDFTGLLDKMIEKGADLFHRDSGGESCIRFMFNFSILDHNTERYLEYAISRGLEVTKKDLEHFYFIHSRLMQYNQLTDADLRRLERIKAILESNVK